MADENNTQQNPSDAEAPDSSQDTNAEDEFHPATYRQKLWLSVFLVLLSVALSYSWYNAYKQMEIVYKKCYSVEWTLPITHALKSGPITFRYDEENKSLQHIGMISTGRKQELVDLLYIKHASENKTDDELKTDIDIKAGYEASVDELAFLSTKESKKYFYLLLLMAGLSGSLGVMVRSISGFIGNACFTKNLDVTVWWPWYVLRPVQGFLLGILAVLIIKSGFISIENAAPENTTWWLAISLLVGFGAEDFTGRLRTVSKALFGQN